jgi:hypothetical protein
VETTLEPKVEQSKMQSLEVEPQIELVEEVVITTLSKTGTKHWLLYKLRL